LRSGQLRSLAISEATVRSASLGSSSAGCTFPNLALFGSDLRDDAAADGSNPIALTTALHDMEGVQAMIILASALTSLSSSSTRKP
jgi:hypothetical protein